MTAAGLGILGALRPALDEAKRFQVEGAKFSLYGMGDRADVEAVKFAKAMGVMGSSYTDNMKLITEAQGVFRESGALNLQQQFVGAKLAAPILAKLNFIEAGLSEDQRASSHTENLAMLRFIESRGGANNPQLFSAIADWGFKLSKSSGGIVPWSQLQQFAATSGAAGFNLTQDAIAKLEPVLADLKGGRTGSGLRVAFQRLLGTQRGLPVQAVSEFIKLGLWDPSKVELNKSGGIKRFLGRPGEVLRDRQLFATDPYEFYTRDYLPALARKYGKGILGDSVQARTERAVETSLVFGPGTASAVFSQLDKLMPAISRSVAAQNKTLGIDAAYKAAGGTLSGKEVDLTSKLANLKEQAGESLLPIAIGLLTSITPILKDIANFATRHPRLFGFAIDSLVSLGVVLTGGGLVVGFAAFVSSIQLLGGLLKGSVIGGGVMSIVRASTLLPRALGILATGLEVGAAVIASPITWIVAGVATIGFAVYEIAKHWDKSKSVFQNIKAELGMFWTFLSSLPGKLYNMLPGWARAGLAAAGSAVERLSGHGPPPPRSAYVPSHALAPSRTGGGNVYLDGKKVGRVLDQLHAQGSAALVGFSGHDPTMSPSYAAGGYHGGR